MAKIRITEVSQLEIGHILIINNSLARVTNKYDVNMDMKNALSSLGREYNTIDQLFDIEFIDPNISIYSHSEWCHLDLKKQIIYNLGNLNVETAKLLYIS